MATENEIRVPALMDGGRVIVPQVWLGSGVDYKTVMDGKKVSVPQEWSGSDAEWQTFVNGQQLTVAEYQKFNPPTLAILRHAFFDKNPDGSFVSLEYRLSVLSNRGRGEWTSTLLRDYNEVIEGPENLHYDKKRRLWTSEGGKVSRVELPTAGWVTEYDTSTGFPSRTSKNRGDAEKVFGEDASYFHANKRGLRVVSRHFFLDDYGSFPVTAHCEPGNRVVDMGVRSFRRSE